MISCYNFMVDDGGGGNRFIIIIHWAAVSVCDWIVVNEFKLAKHTIAFMRDELLAREFFDDHFNRLFFVFDLLSRW